MTPSSDALINVIPAERRSRVAVPSVSGQAYGVRVVVEAESPELLARMIDRLPPGWESCPPRATDPRFVLGSRDGLDYRLAQDGVELCSCDLEVALGLFDAQLRSFVALNAPGLVFVHAGVVAVDGRAIMIPGPSFSGKTTLVAELVKAGATYYSDEYAVIDVDGLVRPYPKPLSMRLTAGSRQQTEQHVSEFGGVAGSDAVPVDLVVAAQYRPGAAWRPTELTSGEAVLELMANTVPAQERPEESLAALRVVAQRARVLRSERGEAATAAEEILSHLAA